MESVFKKNVSLKPYNTFRIDVKAKEFAEWKTEKMTTPLFSEIDKNTLIIGEGSNLLFTKPFDGKVLKICLKGISIIEDKKEYVLVEVEAGEIWDEFVEWAVKNNYSGIENLTLIPGTVGAAPIQNIGAYGVEVQSVIEGVYFYHRETRQKEYLNNKECLFSYRKSIFKTELQGKSIVTSVVFRLKKTFSPNINYNDIKNWFQENNTKATLKSVRYAVSEIRTKKLPTTSLYGNAGSFFKNPEVSMTFFKELQEKNKDIKYYKISDELVKIPAAWLIEKCGWKGYREEQFGVWKTQPLVLVNFGNATGNNIYELSEKIKNSVLKMFGIVLSREVIII